MTSAWPKDSRTAVPSLDHSLEVSYEIAKECTSLKLAPSGRLLAAGFADGSVQLFDTTGTYEAAIVGHIRAKGVHTSLLLHVDISEDGLWCFAGVLRGSMELVAIYLGALEASFANPHGQMLDYITTQRHSDAQLRGFGACTRLTHEPNYLIFTGRAIKNMHLWKFEPHRQAWTQLYNIATNGNTIHFLQFRHSPQGRLQGISKSDGSKLRVWDLKHLDKKPNYIDVPHTEATLGVVGGQCLGGTSRWYRQLSIVQLDVDRHQLASDYNHTELALPGDSDQSRRRRGDLQCVTHMAGPVADARHVLLELSDQSVVLYHAGQLKTLDWPNMPHRRIQVDRVGAQGIAVALMASFEWGVGGTIQLKPLHTDPSPAGFWGFLDVPNALRKIPPTIQATITATPKPVSKVSVPKVSVSKATPSVSKVSVAQATPSVSKPSTVVSKATPSIISKATPTTTTITPANPLVRRAVTQSQQKKKKTKRPVIARRTPGATPVPPAAPSTPAPNVTRQLAYPDDDVKKTPRGRPKRDPATLERIRQYGRDHAQRIQVELHKLDDPPITDHTAARQLLLAKRILQTTLRQMQWIQETPEDLKIAQQTVQQAVSEFRNMHEMEQELFDAPAFPYEHVYNLTTLTDMPGR